ncbi:MAG: nucleotidyltransferase substrate binding protein [Acidimicrobiia bacterium]|nr:nucleotidyltransferase substrate binding protein [Acidimicrobiia bacterium]MCY4456398.1 nucleotidyltransferase substrate binding protein [Acidimicrobiaceae bacterium]
MAINADFLISCIETLQAAHQELPRHPQNSVMYNIYRAAIVKEFEISLEQSGNLLKKRLRPYFASNRQADQLNFKDIFRHASQHGLISTQACERWFQYRNNRNNTAHDYGKEFAEVTLRLIPSFIADATELAQVIVAEPDE